MVEAGAGEPELELLVAVVVVLTCAGALGDEGEDTRLLAKELELAAAELLSEEEYDSTVDEGNSDAAEV